MRLDGSAVTPWLRRCAQFAADVVFPPVCAGCRVSGTWMCDECAALIPLIDPALVCETCGSPDALPGAFRCRSCADWPDELRSVRSVARFDGVMRDVVHRIKYQGESARAAWTGPYLASVVRSAAWEVDVVVPVPLHARRRRRRGFNQAEVIAHALAEDLGIPLAAQVMRVRDTRSQVGLDPGQRALNVASAFQASSQLAGTRVLLVDDVLTTGSTLLACAHACRAVGAADVVAVTLTRAGSATDRT